MREIVTTEGNTHRFGPAAAGSDFAQAVQTRNYVRDAADVPLYNRLYREYFAEPFPARTTTACRPRGVTRSKVVAVKRPA